MPSKNQKNRYCMRVSVNYSALFLLGITALMPSSALELDLPHHVIASDLKFF